MTQLSLIQVIAVAIIPILFAITLHEVSHGWVAKILGDKTAERLGRLTVNPIKHIDPIGTVLVPAALLVMSGGAFVFGWAKPVPITWQNLKNPRRDMALVALAGPLSNFAMAIFWGFIMKIAILTMPQSMSGLALYSMGKIGVAINLVLMILNLIPIPPLDGSRVVASFLSGQLAYIYARIEPFGFFILLGLLIIGVLQQILFPPVIYLYNFIMGVYGLSSYL